MKIKLFLTFDHELPLGGLNTTLEKALFDPTRRVMEIADRHDVKITLFSDILCAERYKEWDYDAFYSPYKTQLQTAISNGHDVQLHIHPHWLTTKYDGKEFHPSRDFALSDFKNDTKFGGINGIIKHSINALQEICLPIVENYKCIAFRAGGYNLHPETETIINSLYENGIRYDSSMARGYYFKSGISEIDFRKLPKYPNWIIDPKNYHSARLNKKGILEIPIATIPKTPFETPTKFKQKKYAFRTENRGKVIHDDYKIDLVSKLKMLFSARMLSFDNHTLSNNYLLRIVKYNINKYKNKTDEIMFSVISHPKTMADYSFELMDNFISSVKKLYPDVEFTTYSQINKKNK